MRSSRHPFSAEEVPGGASTALRGNGGALAYSFLITFRFSLCPRGVASSFAKCWLFVSIRAGRCCTSRPPARYQPQADAARGSEPRTAPVLRSWFAKAARSRLVTLGPSHPLYAL